MGPSLLLRISVVVLAWCTTVLGGTDFELSQRGPDPCAVVGGKKWVSPRDLRACFRSIKVDETVKHNIIDVINKTLAFHTSVNYQIHAPEPFASDVHEDVLASLARISRQRYPSEYDLHIDLSRTLKRLNDGHCVWINSCYVSLYQNLLPTPLSLLTEPDGTEGVYIDPEAFTIASAEFPDQIDVWQNALPGRLKGQLASLSGAKVIAINGRDPFEAVNANALITGSYQALGTRQKAFFSSYQRGSSGWNYVLGNFAQQSLPLDDYVFLTIQRLNHTRLDTVILPYRARFSSSSNAFTDTPSWRANNCAAQNDTNGVDLGASPDASGPPEIAVTRYQQQPPIPQGVARKHLMNVVLDTSPPSDVILPPTLQPSLPAVNGSIRAAQFHMLKDGKTGVLALGSFSDSAYEGFLTSLLQGLLSLKALGATQLVIDVSNNGGGFICAAHWLHRIIAGPKDSTVPQPGLDTEARAGPLAQLITEAIISTPSIDPRVELLYNPLQWNNADNVPFTATTNWLQPTVNSVINDRSDSFSPRLGQECQPGGFLDNPPDVALFDPKKVVIVSNGRCASSCSLFSITMAKKEGSKTVVLGGKKDVKQQYCGTVGGQSTDFARIDTEIKTTHLKDNPLAPPDLLVNGVQGISWRLAFGVTNPIQPEELQDHPADLNLPITPNLVNNPEAIWEEVTRRLLS